MAQFKIGEVLYSSKKLSLFDQFNIARRIAPVVGLTKELSAKVILAFSRLNDDDAKYIVNACLKVTQRQQGDIWASIGTIEAPMFQDMKLLDFFEIADQVIKESIDNFFPELLSKDEGNTPKA